MKKKSVLLLIATCFMLSACNSNKDTTPTVNASSVEYRTEEVQHRKEELSQKEGAAQGNVTYIGSQYDYEDDVQYFDSQDGQSLESGSDASVAEEAMNKEDDLPASAQEGYDEINTDN